MGELKEAAAAVELAKAKLAKAPEVEMREADAELKAAEKAAEAGNKFVILNGVWRYWDVFSHLTARPNVDKHKIEKHATILKCLNNMFSMLCNKLGMSEGHYQEGATDMSGSFKTGQFIDMVTKAACESALALNGSLIAPREPIKKECQFQFKAFVHRVQVLVKRAVSEEDLENKGGALEILKLAMKKRKQLDPNSTDQAQIAMLKKVEDKYKDKKDEFKEAQRRLKQTQDETKKRKEDKKKADKKAKLDKEKQEKEELQRKIEEVQKIEEDETSDTLQLLAAGVVAVAAVGGAYAWWKSRK